MKHLKLFAALCCAAVLFAACDKSNEPSNGANNRNEPEPQKHDTTLWFNYMGYDSIAPENIQRYLSDKNVSNIYLEPNQPIDFVNATTDYITALCERVFKPALNTNPERVHGRGNFLFYPGEALPADSLWLVQQGWTINQPQR